METSIFQFTEVQHNFVHASPWPADVSAWRKVVSEKSFLILGKWDSAWGNLDPLCADWMRRSASAPLLSDTIQEDLAAISELPGLGERYLSQLERGHLCGCCFLRLLLFGRRGSEFPHSACEWMVLLVLLFAHVAAQRSRWSVAGKIQVHIELCRASSSHTAAVCVQVCVCVVGLPCFGNSKQQELLNCYVSRR